MSSLYYHCKFPNFLFGISLPPSPLSSSSTKEVSFLHHFPTTTPITTPTSTKFSAPRRRRRCCCSPNPNKFPSQPAAVRRVPVRKTSSSFPARDRIIPFGRHKGKRLGSLPSSYLKWVSKNLQNTDFLLALRADEVLNDPVYRDRIEWECVQKIMEEDGFGTSTFSRITEVTPGDLHSEILEIAEKFDWDMEDRMGWSKVDYELLGTSHGGRIPRKKKKKEEEGKGEEKQSWSTRDKFSKASDTKEASAMVGDRRRERRERRMLKSEKELGERDGEVGGTTGESGLDSDGDDQVVFGETEYLRLGRGVRFPGRESLFKKVVSDPKRSS